MRRSKLLVQLGAMFLIFAALSLTVGGWQRGEFLFLEEIQPGMQGICKTVVKGDKISTFPFEVVDVLHPIEGFGDVILIRTWGEAIEESGGISAGMSGSPCYIDDKLIGGIFAVYAEDEFTDVTLIEERPHAVVQPIENMLRILDICTQRIGNEVGMPGPKFADLFMLPGREIAVASKTGRIDKIKKVVANHPSRKELQDSPRTLFVRRLTTPVMVSGLSERAFSWLKNGVDRELVEEYGGSLLHIRGERTINSFSRLLDQGLEERYGWQLHWMGSAAQGQPGADPSQLESGSPIGVALMLGDVTIGAFGTITYMEGQCLVAFGHYFLTGGEINLPMTAVSVIDTVKSVKYPFKIGFIRDEIGAILEDRRQGIAGAIGVQAETIQLNFTITDKDTGRTRQFEVRSVTLPDFHPENIFIAGVGAVDQAIDRIGQGTLNLRLTIEGVGMPRALRRNDIFVSESDVAATGPLQVSLIDFLLAWNEFIDPQISEIDVEMEVEQAIRTKIIEAVEPLQTKIRSGDELCYRVTLQPYRQMQEVVQDCIIIPEWVAGDVVALAAYPARDQFWKFDYDKPWVRPISYPILDFNDLFRAIEKAPSNDLMIVAVYSVQKMPLAIYEYAIISVGDWVVSGFRESENVVSVR